MPVNRYQFGTVYQIMYSSLGGQRPRIEVTIAHRKPRTILGGVTEVTFCSKFNRLGGDVAHTYIPIHMTIIYYNIDCNF